MAARALRAFALQFLAASAFALVMRGGDNDEEKIGQVNQYGVTKYSKRQIRAVRNVQHDNWWPDGTRELRAGEDLEGATDLTENISWGWHHPNGVWNTIPVGGPMIDGNMNVYLAADDAIRKFSPIGDLLWSYAPRGQIAATPALLSSVASTLRGVEPPEFKPGSAEEEDALEAEEELRPEWASRVGTKVQRLETQVKVGDRLKVRPGMGYHADGVEYFKAGDKGKVTNITRENGEERAIITWPRTGYESVAGIVTLSKRFLLLKRRGTMLPAMMVASTTNGYVFAIEPETGEELWATKVSERTAGVKGATNGYMGVIVAAGERCENHLCYRFRNQTNKMIPANNVIHGLDAADGSSIWSFTPRSPVWNFVPFFTMHHHTAVFFFSDIEAGCYCVEVHTGKLVWSQQGTLGTYTQAAGVYATGNRHFYTLGHRAYDYGDVCNPAGPPGILPGCEAGPRTPGYVKAFDSRNGNPIWETDVPFPPANGVVGALRFQKMHSRLIVTLGYSCAYNSPTEVWVIDPFGARRMQFKGPTMWSNDCPGEIEAADYRRATGGRDKCEPSSWTKPAIDSTGDLYLGNQVGTIQRWSSPDDTPHAVRVVSTLDTGMGFQEAAIAFAPGMMAVATCSSLIVFQTYTANGSFGQENWALNESSVKNLY